MACFGSMGCAGLFLYQALVAQQPHWDKKTPGSCSAKSRIGPLTTLLLSDRPQTSYQHEWDYNH